MRQLEQHQLAETFTCDRLLALGARDIESFHALPLAKMASVKSSKLRDKYEELFGHQVLGHDLSYTDMHFDTPAMPRSCVEESPKMTAEAFGAAYTCYVTTGTTTSNYIAVFALAETGTRILANADRPRKRVSAHQARTARSAVVGHNFQSAISPVITEKSSKSRQMAPRAIHYPAGVPW